MWIVIGGEVPTGSKPVEWRDGDGTPGLGQQGAPDVAKGRSWESDGHCHVQMFVWQGIGRNCETSQNQETVMFSGFPSSRRRWIQAGVKYPHRLPVALS